MKFSSQQYAQALYDAVHETSSKDHDVVLDNFVKILAQAGDLNKYPEIEKEYHLLEMKEKGISSAEVTVAKDIEINSALIGQLNEIIGNKVEVKKKVDEGIVGGVVVRVDDTLIDASIKTQLESLNSELKS
ncbi:MAG: ATP synthase F1 subunit delta [Candidatus Doudnabacteria bacterium]|nr:ATP synthase F1 subunit delta [Candidatus Doudnabacteria bacterium]